MSLSVLPRKTKKKPRKGKNAVQSGDGFLSFIKSAGKISGKVLKSAPILSTIADLGGPKSKAVANILRSQGLGKSKPKRKSQKKR